MENGKYIREWKLLFKSMTAHESKTVIAQEEVRNNNSVNKR